MIKKYTLRSLVILASITPYILWQLKIGITIRLGVYEYAPVQLGYAALLMLIVFLMHGREAFRSMGLGGGFVKGFLFALICTLPMFITSALTSSIDPKRFSSWYQFLILINLTFVAGFFEEFFFRGFLFGQLFRYCRWGFFPAVLLQCVLFGLVHLLQGYDLLSSLSVMLVTALGGIFFAWVYVESGFNLWCSIFLHALMNLSWLMFTADHLGAVGNISGNIARAVTVCIAIGMIIIKKRTNKEAFFLSKKNRFISSE